MIAVNRHLLCLYTRVPAETPPVTAYTIGNGNPFIGRSNITNPITIHHFHRINTRHLTTPTTIERAKVYRVVWIFLCKICLTLVTVNGYSPDVWGEYLPGLTRHLHLEDSASSKDRKKVRHSSFFTQHAQSQVEFGQANLTCSRKIEEHLWRVKNNQCLNPLGMDGESLCFNIKCITLKVW